MNDSKFKFCFTLDTEPDNLWEYSATNSFEHMLKMVAFEDRMRAAGSVQTYLTTSEVAESPEGHEALGRILSDGSAEIGVHFHTWTREWPFDVPELRDPPVFAMVHQLPRHLEQQMLDFTIDVLKRQFGIEPTSYRGGRWSFGKNTAGLLAEAGILVDSTVLPGIDWSDHSQKLVSGPDFSQSSRYPVYLETEGKGRSIVQVPVGAASLQVGLQKRMRDGSLPFRVVGRIARELGIPSGSRTLRPATTTLSDMTAVLQKLKEDEVPVWVFMIHSSEIIPCRPLPTEQAVRLFVERCEEIVGIAQGLGATAATLTEAAEWLVETKKIADT